MIPLHLCHFKHLPIFEQLELEEALLRAGVGNWCFINEGSPSAIVMGISAKPDEVINQEHFKKNPIPIIRRFSGGGTVVVEESTLFVSFIFDKKALQMDTCPQKLLQWSGEQYAPLFHHTNFRLLENDYVIGDKKIGGNAQYFTKDRLVHHTSFLWDYSPDLMRYLCMPPKIPTYREKRSHEAFLTTLKPHFASKDVFVEMLKKSLKSRFLLQESSHETSLDLARPFLSRPHRKSLKIETLSTI